MTASSIIEVNALGKWYGDFEAIKSISFSISRGEIVGFLGPNGSGKTTTLRILATSLYPSSGDVHVCGHSIYKDSDKIRPFIGYLPEKPPLYEDMKTLQYLKYVCLLKKMPGKIIHETITNVVDSCRLQDVKHNLIRTLSK